jgi:hypothetical protein
MSLFATVLVVAYAANIWVAAISSIETLQLWTWLAAAMGTVFRIAQRYDNIL